MFFIEFVREQQCDFYSRFSRPVAAHRISFQAGVCSFFLSLKQWKAKQDMSNDDTRARNNRRLRLKVTMMDNFTKEYVLLRSLCPKGGGGQTGFENLLCLRRNTVATRRHNADSFPVVSLQYHSVKTLSFTI